MCVFVGVCVCICVVCAYVLCVSVCVCIAYIACMLLCMCVSVVCACVLICHYQFIIIIINYRECKPNGLPFHLFRLLLLYHDPELCSFLDTKKLLPDEYLLPWVRQLGVSMCWLTYFYLLNNNILVS